jgi:hypothetical protein
MEDFPHGQVMWLAFVETVEKVEIVAKGTGQRVMKNRVKNPYVVRDEEGEEFVIAREDLCDSPRCANLKQAELRAQFGYEDEEDEDLDDDEEYIEGEDE